MSIYKRNEFFGAILYDTVQKEYLYCDKFTRFLIDNEFINKNDQQIDKKILHRFDVTQEEYECICSDLHDLIKDDDIKDVENNVIENMLSAPLRVFLDFTYACNLRCKHCLRVQEIKKMMN